MKQSEIINQSKENFSQLTGLDLDFDFDKRKEKSIDAMAVVTDPVTHKTTTFLVEMKNELRATDTANIVSQKHKDNWLLIAQYISKPQREILKSNKINYLDSSGNCFINYRQFFVFIDNQKTQEQRATKSNKLFTEKGMRLIYAMLLNNELVNYTYRQITDEVNIALGTVGNLLGELEEQGFVKINREERVLQNKMELFDKWAAAFDTTLRPWLYQNRLRFVNKQDLVNWQKLNLGNAYWGGEPAAYLLDKFLRPEQFIIFSEKSTTQIMKDFKMLPDTGGEVILMQPPLKNRKEADPFLIYAELIHSKDSRCLEAAQRIKEKYIDKR